MRAFFCRLLSMTLSMALSSAISSCPLTAMDDSASPSATRCANSVVSVSYTHLQVFLTERFLPGWAPLHILLAGFWASWVASRLGDRDAAPRTRLFIWCLFSVAFFVQLALGLAGYGLFLMTGNLHLPVPGMILAAPLYRRCV